ncbi:NlpC/P60 family protein [Anaerobacillus alkaliphilus]|uniref:NlpC/P60 family protein n=1 Tax=Anaerobacillus alkaliphilus TaxID=1548597 RepID=A0A4Q0VL74_9BACI|nr:C40 family peptidase [Anaerobacillus alkaliphilus]RXI96158.1 NlpC/P60 family protein [Anaerobacillus alkaliphilus]
MIADKIIDTGLSYLGTPYVFNAPPFQTNTFDCSSFIQYIFQEHGIELPRNSRQQFIVGKKVAFKDLKKGDLLFFTTEKRRTNQGIEKVGHVALYLGKGTILHTSRKEKEVHIAALRPLLLEGRYLGSKRVL